MRILHITNDYFNSGVYQTLHEGLLAQGVDSAVFVPLRKKDIYRNLDRVTEAHCFHDADRFFYMNKQRKVYNSLRPVIQEERPDLLHGYFLFSAGISCLWAKQEFDIPYVITVQNTDVNTIYRWFVHLRGLGRKIIREASMVFFASNSYRQFVLEHMIDPEDRVAMSEKFRTVPFAVDPFWINSTYEYIPLPKDNTLNVITAGVVNRSKNQQTAAEAVELLRAKGKDVTLTIVGRATDEKLERYLCRKPYVRRIHHLPKEKLLEEYRKADLFLLPSLTESFGLVYAEALSQGIPVLYSAGQGFDEQFSEGYVGYRVNAQSAEDIASKIEQAMQEYTSLQSNCIVAAQTFDCNAVCQRIVSIYQEILDGPTRYTPSLKNTKETT